MRTEIQDSSSYHTYLRLVKLVYYTNISPFSFQRGLVFICSFALAGFLDRKAECRKKSMLGWSSIRDQLFSRQKLHRGKTNIILHTSLEIVC